MRNIILVLVTILFASCLNNEKEYLEIIKQNNAFLQDEISFYNARLNFRSQEQPELYDTITCKKITNLYVEVLSIKDNSDCKLINSRIKKIAFDEELNIKFDSITSTEKDILKNNLLLNLVNLNKFFYAKKSLVIRDIAYFPGIKNEVKNDTLILNFIHHNKYTITTDSIIDGKDKVSNFKSYNECIIGQIKYKANSNKSTYYGKIFAIDTDGNTQLIENIKHTITK